jgi:hypothetical protein
MSITLVTMLLLALQWGGNVKAWSDPAVVTTLVLVRFEHFGIIGFSVVL